MDLTDTFSYIVVKVVGSLNVADKSQIQTNNNVVVITEKRHLWKPNLHLMASFSLLFSSLGNNFFCRSKNIFN